MGSLHLTTFRYPLPRQPAQSLKRCAALGHVRGKLSFEPQKTITYLAKSLVPVNAFITQIDLHIHKTAWALDSKQEPIVIEVISFKLRGVFEPYRWLIGRPRLR